MPRPTLQDPQRGDARTRLLDAARDLFRARGYAGTSIDELCRTAGVTKGAFFHHFATKEALGVAAADGWTAQITAFFAEGPYHEPADPVDRLLAYVAFRRAMIEGEIAGFCCLAGTLAGEVYVSSPEITTACATAIFGHAATLEADFAEALARRPCTAHSAASLARYTQTVIQGAFVLAKASGDPAMAREALDHLAHYLRLLFQEP